MKMKLSLAVALSHNPKLLILDEATSGMDPIVRAEVLDILWDFVQNPAHSVFISSHITSDLERICDYITFIHDGKIVLSSETDKILEEHKVVRCGSDELGKIPKDKIIGSRENRFGHELLVKTLSTEEFGGMVCDKAGIDDIMTFYIGGS